MPAFDAPGHEIVLGAIGMGKSMWTLYRIIESFRQDKPCCYIDPRGDTYWTLMAILEHTRFGEEVMKRYGHRIIFLNPVAKSDTIVGFNALAPVGSFDYATPDEVALLANSVTSHIRRQAGWEANEAIRFQEIMEAGIGLFNEAQPGKYTLAELPLLFAPTDTEDGKNAFVKHLFANEVRHYGTQAFWNDMWASWNKQNRREWTHSSQSRIFQYLFDERVLFTTCTTRNASIDFRKVVNEGQWVFVHIPYPLLSDTLSTVIGNLIITKIFYAAMQRPVGQRPYRLILDEARFFNTGPLEMILETSRPYNLWITMVVQSLDQMARMHDGRIDERLRETALDLCRYFSIFQSYADSETLAKMMFPVTGQVQVGERMSGDPEYLPVPAEQDEYRRRFMHLRHREVILYDKHYPTSPRVYTTPDVDCPKLEMGPLTRFETCVLQATGKPAESIRNEIAERQAPIRAMLKLEKPTKWDGQARQLPAAPLDQPLPPESVGDL